MNEEAIFSQIKRDYPKARWMSPKVIQWNWRK